MRGRILGLVVVGCALAIGFGVSPALAATPLCTWIGASGADWNNAANWSCANTADTIPTSSDDVAINAFGNPDIGTADANARSIAEDVNGTFSIETGETLTISSSGSTSLSGHVNVNGTGVLTLGDATTLTSTGVITDAGTVNVNSSLSIPAANTVGGGGVLKVGANGSINADPGASKFVTVVPEVDNDGTCVGCGVNVTSGTFELWSGDAGSTTGNYAVASGATLQVDKGTLDSPSVTGSGTVFVNGSSHLTVGSTDTFTPGGLTISGGGAPEATLNKDVSVGTLTMSGFGVRDGTGTLMVTGTADFAGDCALDGGTTTIADTVTSATIDAGDLKLDGGSTLTLDAPTTRTTNGPIELGPDNTAATLNIDSTYDITGANAPFVGSSTSVVHVGATGSLMADPGANQEADIEAPLDNDGTVTAKTGTLALFAGTTGTSSGGFVIDTPATLELEGSKAFESASVTGAGEFFAFGPNVTVGGGDTFSPGSLRIDNGSTFTLNRDVSVANLLRSGLGTRDGTGTLTITGGLTPPAPTLHGGTTTVAASASPLTLDTGGFTVDGATLNLDVPTTLASSSFAIGSNATVNINSTFLDSTSQFWGGDSSSAIHVGSTGTLTVNPGVGLPVVTNALVQNDGTIAVASGTLNSAGLTQSGGTTTVDAGAELDGPVTLTGGTLKGGGTLGGPVSNSGGTVAPGSSPGTLTDRGDYTQSAGGTLAEEITGTSPGTQFDQLLVDGALSLGGKLAIDSTSFTPASTDTFKIISGASSRAGTFATLTGATVNGATYSPQYDTDGVTLLVSGPPPPPNQTLSVAFVGIGAGSVSDSASLSCSASCQHQYPQGTVVHLTATPAAGSTFTGWSGGGCSGTGVCTVTMSADQALTATFDTIPPLTHSLTVNTAGSGSGSVTSSPAGINCGSTCSHAFTAGTQVTLTATADSGSTFEGWSGGGCSGTATCTVTLNSDATVTATFTANPPPPTQCIVPKLEGKKLGTAKIALRRAHCRVGKVTHVKSTRKHKNRVISQSPRPGTHLKKGAEVALKVGT